MWGPPHHGHHGHRHGHGHGHGYPPQPNPGMYSGQPQVSLSWVPASHGQIPRGALSAGPGVFVARARHAGELIPGKAVQGHRSAYVPYGSQENCVNEYEVLCDTHLDCFGCNFKWERSDGRVPHGALIGGYTNDRQPLYIARAMIAGEWVVGKAFEPHNCAYFPHGGQEHRMQQFEVLVTRS